MASESFATEIRRILVQHEGTGFFSENVSIDGRTIIHRFSLAVGWSWSFSRRDYISRFGPLPDWVLVEHPYKRSCLCRLALREEIALPDARIA